MSNKKIPQSLMEEYLEDFNESYEAKLAATLNYNSDTMAIMFWSYVDGREHKEKPAPKLIPVRGKWTMPMPPQGRLQILHDLICPQDEDGNPIDPLISKDQYMELLDEE